MLTGVVAVLYAWLIDLGYEIFAHGLSTCWWLPLLLSPSLAAIGVWLTRHFFAGSEGSGIPQVIAMLQGKRERAPNLLTARIVLGKIGVSFLCIAGGFTIGREGPTIHVGAALMYNLRGLYPARLRRIGGPAVDRKLILAGAAAGLSAAFNTPLAGVVFAIEELMRSFERRINGVILSAIVFAGLVSLAMQGNYTYFGSIAPSGQSHKTLAVAVVAIGVVAGIAGGVFCWLLLNPARWLPARTMKWRSAHPILFAAVCGLVIAAVGVGTSGHTFGSGYAEARSKMVSMIGSYLPGSPGGIFAPSLAIGAGLGNASHHVFSQLDLPTLIALGMVGYLAAVTQSPITALIIVVEIIDRHSIVISLMATALVSSQVSKFFSPPLYEALSRRYVDPW
ncbi:chloride channel protein [Caballeronia sp. INSB1]|uniref:chloride channel protein n=1 Tax=Caballeronia sp. INSB1 TaxID=2921751 RepID=UPI0020330595|nr:chloride channel protein [Caballeronia sp. INSB1]